MPGAPLAYDHSKVGGVNSKFAEQRDYVCARCGDFQYRHHTRSLRRLTG